MEYIMNGNPKFIVEMKETKKQPVLKKEIIGFYSKTLRMRKIGGRKW